jgi:hypothetical protein
MKYKYLFLLLTSLIAVASCKPGKSGGSKPDLAISAKPLKTIKLSASTQHNIVYKNIPSASGIEYALGSYYVLGDDSPYLYQLNEQYELVRKYALMYTASFKNSRIPKSIKPDLESIAHFKYGRDEMFLLLGSGSTSARNKGYLVNASNAYKVQEVDLTKFYEFLKGILKIEKEGVLNIEGLAIDKTYTYLLQRPLGSSSNVLFRFDTDAFKDFLLRQQAIPAAALYHFDLPAIGNNTAGFSGAFTLGDKLFFTASVEDTPNAIDDGEVLGSFVGVIDLRALPYASNQANPLKIATVQLKNTDGSIYKGKAESLVVTEVEPNKKYKVVVVVDDDKGSSELIEVELKMDQDSQD